MASAAASSMAVLSDSPIKKVSITFSSRSSLVLPVFIGRIQTEVTTPMVMAAATSAVSR